MQAHGVLPNMQACFESVQKYIYLWNTFCENLRLSCVFVVAGHHFTSLFMNMTLPSLLLWIR